MKLIFRLLFFSILLLGISSCEKDENKIYYEEGTPPVLTANQTGTIPLSFTTQDEEAIRLTWTNPNYKFTTGTSSQNVSYLLEIDTAGANFTNPNRQSISVSQDLERTFIQSQLNDYLLNQLVLVPGIPHNIEIRVTSRIGTNTLSLLSNVLPFSVTPYTIPPKVEPPASGELYITGSAVASDWTNAPPATQKFTRISNTFYELDIALAGGKSYTFLPVHGSWDYKYSISVKNDPNLIYGGDFKSGGEDILAPPVTGMYQIEVDFQRGKFKVTKL